MENQISYLDRLNFKEEEHIHYSKGSRHYKCECCNKFVKNVKQHIRTQEHQNLRDELFEHYRRGHEEFNRELREMEIEELEQRGIDYDDVHEDDLN